MTELVIPFPTLESALDALRAWAEENNMHPWELLDCWYVGATFKQITDPAFNEKAQHGILFSKGKVGEMPSAPMPQWLQPITEEEMAAARERSAARANELAGA